MIVFCSSCNTPYHQYCHDPPIDREVVLIAEKDWFCSPCTRSRDEPAHSAESLVSGSNLTADEVCLYPCLCDLLEGCNTDDGTENAIFLDPTPVDADSSPHASDNDSPIFITLRS